MKVDSIGVKLGETFVSFILSFFVFIWCLWDGGIGSFICEFIAEMEWIWVGEEYEPYE